MSAERLSMRKLREILRLRFEKGCSQRAIAASCAVGASTVADYLLRAREAKLTWPLEAALDDEALERRLFPHEYAGLRLCPEPDYAWMHLELKKKHVTKMLLWQEYREQHPEGYQYSQFCERYREWHAGLSVTMCQDHRAGEKMFVDFSGDGIPIVNPQTGEVSVAKLFVAVLGASNLTYIEPVLHEDLATWIACHVRALAYFGGVAAIWVPDNLKSGVKHADYYDPELNPTYADLCRHYGAVVIPARKRKPRDKAKVEQGVLLAERWVLAVLRHRDFTSFAEVCEAVRPLCERLNERPMQKLKKSRREVFESIERAALQPLPSTPYELCEWKRVKVNIDYHIQFDDHYYSVHYTHYSKGQRDMEVRATATTIEIFYAGRRVASHVRSFEKYHHTTKPEHRPASHNLHLEWTPSRIIAWGKSIGPNTGAVLEEILRRRQHPEQGFRSCLGVIRLRERYPTERLERACARALKYGTLNRRSIDAILRNNLDSDPDEPEAPQLALPLHGNLRGSGYYH
jgi:transposase